MLQWKRRRKEWNFKDEVGYAMIRISFVKKSAEGRYKESINLNKKSGLLDPDNINKV